MNRHPQYLNATKRAMIRLLTTFTSIYDRGQIMTGDKSSRFPVERIHKLHEIKILKHFGHDGVTVAGRDKRFAHFSPVLICFTNRSGSNALAEDLSQIPTCGLGKELMNHQAVVQISGKKGFAHLTDYLHHILANQQCDRPAVKVSVDQLLFLQASGVLEHCLYNAQAIHIRRRDLLSQAVSFFIASVTKEWTSEHNKKSDPPEFDERQILRILKNVSDANSRFDTTLSLLGLPNTTVFYEDHVNSRRDSLIRLSSFLGMNAVEFTLPEKRKTQRQTSADKIDFTRRIRAKYGIHSAQ